MLIKIALVIQIFVEADDNTVPNFIGDPNFASADSIASSATNNHAAMVVGAWPCWYFTQIPWMENMLKDFLILKIWVQY